jgi:hypothetical protein
MQEADNPAGPFGRVPKMPHVNLVVADREIQQVSN